MMVMMRSMLLGFLCPLVFFFCDNVPQILFFGNRRTSGNRFIHLLGMGSGRLFGLPLLLFGGVMMVLVLPLLSGTPLVMMLMMFAVMFVSVSSFHIFFVFNRQRIFPLLRRRLLLLPMLLLYVGRRSMNRRWSRRRRCRRSTRCANITLQ